MAKKRYRATPGSEGFSMVDPRVIDPNGELIQYEHLGREDLDQVVKVIEALHRWHRRERSLSEASRRYMRLGATDMRALRYVIAARHHDIVVTPGALATHLDISTASVTKMLDRLVAAGHIRRLPHPEDRRSVAVEVTEQARHQAREVVGRNHSARFEVAVNLRPEERAAVIRFLDGLSATASHHHTTEQSDPTQEKPR